MNDHDPVRAQYEALPYPERNPDDEAKRLVTGSPSQWTEVVHTLFGGRAPKRPLKILVAGGGTGDALTMLAQQTADAGVNAHILNLDLSEASSAIARRRIEARGLQDRVTFAVGSLTEAAEHAQKHGPFDYIDCCGVLHHLPDPSEGFRALAKALTPNGGMGLMVYGEYGRTGVYEMQEALRYLAPASEPPAERIRIASDVLGTLPRTNRFARNPFLRDHLESDAGLFDLLLHSTDRAYRADELTDEIEAAGLRIVRWVDPLRYEPELYLPQGGIAKRAGELGDRERAALAEALAGNMRKHICYVVRSDNKTDPQAKPSPDAIPVFRDDATKAQFHAMPKGARAVPFETDGLNVTLPLPEGADALIHAIDGKRSLDKIRKSLPGRPDKAAFKALFDGVWRPLNGFSKLFLTR